MNSENNVGEALRKSIIGDLIKAHNNLEDLLEDNNREYFSILYNLDKSIISLINDLNSVPTENLIAIHSQIKEIINLK